MFDLETHLDEQDRNVEFDQLFQDTVETHEKRLTKYRDILVDAVDTYRDEQCQDIADLLIAIMNDDNAKGKAAAMIEALAINMTKAEIGE